MIFTFLQHLEPSTRQQAIKLNPFRYRLTTYQKFVLEKAKTLMPPPSVQQRAQLAKALHLTDRKVYDWMLKEKKNRLSVLGNETGVKSLFVLFVCLFVLRKYI